MASSFQDDQDASVAAVRASMARVSLASAQQSDATAASAAAESAAAGSRRASADDDDDEPDDAEYEDNEMPPAACPVCQYLTLREAGTFDICVLCGWEDDGSFEDRAHEALGGPNKTYSLAEARQNFAKFLTMYRPDDAFLFLRATDQELLLKKERVCIGLEARDRAPQNEDAWVEFDRQWPVIEAERERVLAAVEADREAQVEQERELELLQQQAIEARAAAETVKALASPAKQSAPQPKKAFAK